MKHSDQKTVIIYPLGRPERMLWLSIMGAHVNIAASLINPQGRSIEGDNVELLELNILFQTRRPESFSRFSVRRATLNRGRSNGSKQCYLWSCYAMKIVWFVCFCVAPFRLVFPAGYTEPKTCLKTCCEKIFCIVLLRELCDEFYSVVRNVIRRSVLKSNSMRTS